MDKIFLIEKVTGEKLLNTFLILYYFCRKQTEYK